MVPLLPRLTTVGASLLAKVVNDDVGILNERGALRFFAGKPAPTKERPNARSAGCDNSRIKPTGLFKLGARVLNRSVPFVPEAQHDRKTRRHSGRRPRRVFLRHQPGAEGRRHRASLYGQEQSVLAHAAPGRVYAP